MDQTVLEQSRCPDALAAKFVAAQNDEELASLLDAGSDPNCLAPANWYRGDGLTVLGWMSAQAQPALARLLPLLAHRNTSVPLYQRRQDGVDVSLFEYAVSSLTEDHMVLPAEGLTSLLLSESLPLAWQRHIGEALLNLAPEEVSAANAEEAYRAIAALICHAAFETPQQWHEIFDRYPSAFAMFARAGRFDSIARDNIYRLLAAVKRDGIDPNTLLWPGAEPGHTIVSAAIAHDDVVLLAAVERLGCDIFRVQIPSDVQGAAVVMDSSEYARFHRAHDCIQLIAATAAKRAIYQAIGKGARH